MEFVSEDGGETYNKCHFVSTSLFEFSNHVPVPQLTYFSGPTLRLAAWSGSDPRRTLTTSHPGQGWWLLLRAMG